MKVPYWLFCTIALCIALTSIEEIRVAGDSQTVSRVPTTQKVVALTLDDGPNSRVTPEILAVLKEKQVRATFFVLGENVEHYPKILAQEVADGHEIGIHTYSHPSLPKLSPNKITEEFAKAESAITPIAPKPTLFRPPGGLYNSRVIETAHERGYTVILWSVDPRDWSCPPSAAVIDKVMKEVTPGSIILLHDGQYPLPTPKALAAIIDGLRARGYDFVTVSELLQYNEVRHTFNFFNL
ncbi:polysaccharide deacetylase family protein [Sporomusa acidovorans]|uniref:Peptidoglycan-N-acetylglucosamine deacetylase n=1 Tax=Sporomusa acidovorans (strain ATCC 49682 / DSM 3132 / Mol) TaxID=1123286 RepID=A0ABZ3J609_SPOA4|nr:polysaccharide deacetylase family protein [Sporomusa acidovorans]OZC15390.1 peptidoglycan-N-acetylmuramic acid deacetylase PdaC [Sporomusa acidovorans DSM 3132]SDF13563.1 polysaccharide deacetylase family sporulation protein PdaB [Sporomusa acidovorans]